MFTLLQFSSATTAKSQLHSRPSSSTSASSSSACAVIDVVTPILRKKGQQQEPGFINFEEHQHQHPPQQQRVVFALPALQSSETNSSLTAQKKLRRAKGPAIMPVNKRSSVPAPALTTRRTATTEAQATARARASSQGAPASKLSLTLRDYTVADMHCYRLLERAPAFALGGIRARRGHRRGAAGAPSHTGRSKPSATYETRFGHVDRFLRVLSSPPRPRRSLARAARRSALVARRRGCDRSANAHRRLCCNAQSHEHRVKQAQLEGQHDKQQASQQHCFIAPCTRGHTGVPRPRARAACTAANLEARFEAGGDAPNHSALGGYARRPVRGQGQFARDQCQHQ